MGVQGFTNGSSTHVYYSCGSCGYELNLNSDNRSIDSNYEKVIKRGVITFFSIDETRFTQIQQLKWTPYFTSKHSWGLFRSRTKLLCRNCSTHIGNSSWTVGREKMQSTLPLDSFSDDRVYDIKIRALQPSSSSSSSKDLCDLIICS